MGGANQRDWTLKRNQKTRCGGHYPPNEGDQFFLGFNLDPGEIDEGLRGRGRMYAARRNPVKKRVVVPCARNLGKILNHWERTGKPLLKWVGLRGGRQPVLRGWGGLFFTTRQKQLRSMKTKMNGLQPQSTTGRVGWLWGAKARFMFAKALWGLLLPNSGAAHPDMGLARLPGTQRAAWEGRPDMGMRFRESRENRNSKYWKIRHVRFHERGGGGGCVQLGLRCPYGLLLLPYSTSCRRKFLWSGYRSGPGGGAQGNCAKGTGTLIDFPGREGGEASACCPIV